MHKYIFIGIGILFIAGILILKESVPQSVFISENTQVVVDTQGREVVVPKIPRRIAITSPYIAEMVTALDEMDRVVAVDKMTYQNSHGYYTRLTKEMVIGPSEEYGFNLEHLVKTRPDIVIVTSAVDWRRLEAVLAPFGIPVIVINAQYIVDFAENFRLLGELFQKQEKAKQITETYLKPLSYVTEKLKNVPKKRVYFECRRPNRAVIGQEGFNQILIAAHAENVFEDAVNIWVNPEAILLKNPDAIIRIGDLSQPFSSEAPSPVSVQRTYRSLLGRQGWEQLKAAQQGQVMFMSYYVQGCASKIIGALYVAKFLYPEYLPELNPEVYHRLWITREQKRKYESGHVYLGEKQ